MSVSPRLRRALFIHEFFFNCFKRRQKNLACEERRSKNEKNIDGK